MDKVPLNYEDIGTRECDVIESQALAFISFKIRVARACCSSSDPRLILVVYPLGTIKIKMPGYLILSVTTSSDVEISGLCLLPPEDSFGVKS